MDKKAVLLTIEYDGTGFAGWQFQGEGKRTVQSVLEDAICKLTGEEVRLRASGRTDAGVHAMGQLAAFDTASKIPIKNIQTGLNSLAPADVKILKARYMDYGFNPRKVATLKTYRYVILNRETPSPLLAKRAWHVRYKLDLELMRKAAVHLIGEQDFSSFRGAKSDVKHSIRRINDVKIRKKSGNIVEIEVKGPGFLKHMVRNIAGTLVHVGLNKMSPNEFKRVIKAKDRRRAGPTAPAHGLFLIGVKL